MFDVTYIGAFIAGLLSFLSPCILPIVPFYLSYLAGVGMNTLTAGTEISGRLRRKAIISALFFEILFVIFKRFNLNSDSIKSI